MNTQTTMQTFDWGAITALADDGSRPPSVAYEFSNGRKFYRTPVPKNPSNHDPIPDDPNTNPSPPG